MTIKELILATIDDSISDFLYYDRKNDEELPRGAIQKAIADGGITIEEIIEQFKTSIINALKD